MLVVVNQNMVGKHAAAVNSVKGVMLTVCMAHSSNLQKLVSKKVIKRFLTKNPVMHGLQNIIAMSSDSILRILLNKISV